MGDEFVVTENKGGDFERVPCGAQPAVAAKLYNLGLQPGFQGKKPCKQVVILFELAARRARGDNAGQRFGITATYNASFGSEGMPSKLRTHLVSWRGRDFTTDELNRFDLRKILGHNCTLSLVEQKKADGKTFAKVIGIMPPMPGIEKMTPETPVDFVPEWVAQRQAAQLQVADEPAVRAMPDDEKIPF